MPLGFGVIRYPSVIYHHSSDRIFVSEDDPVVRSLQKPTQMCEGRVPRKDDRSGFRFGRNGDRGGMNRCVCRN